jgi:8-hydroxy-5-deazaflavin:NADPH oxidoreductase
MTALGLYNITMKYAVLGYGQVGQTITKKLVELGHDVYVGTRNPADPEKLGMIGQLGPQVSLYGYQEAAYKGDVVINCTPGDISLEVIEQIGEAPLHDKVLIDLANYIKFENDVMKLGYSPDTSLAEQIQALTPSSKVVKTLNTVNNDVMVNPSLVPGEHVVFTSSDFDEASRSSSQLLQSFGWPAERIVQLPKLESARATEAYLNLWLKLMAVAGTMQFNISINKA